MEGKIKGPESSQEMAGDDATTEDVLSKLDPALIHQILLTESTDFSSLSMPDFPERSLKTLSYEGFNECLETSDISSLEQDTVVKKAVRDHALGRITQKPDDLTPFQDLLLELNNNIRGLIPNRKDLHSLLEDSKVQKVQKFSELILYIKTAARALAKLESEVRVESTQKLLNKLEIIDNDDGYKLAEECVMAILYLMYKTELCESDKQHFYLENIWAPKIHKEGPDFERKDYQRKFGSFSDPNSSPATRQWISFLFESEGKENAPNSTVQQLKGSSEARKDMIRSSWIEDIVFRDTQQKSIPLPEILSYDMKRLEILREVTKVAVAGCALALHACSAANANPQEVLTTVGPQSLQRRRENLLEAMKNRFGKPSEDYEMEVVRASVALAQEWTTSLAASAKESLSSRVIAVLRGQDPVLKLLNTRIKETMRDVLLQKLYEKSNVEAKNVPKEIKSGRDLGIKATIPKNEGKRAQAHERYLAEKLFCQRGLAFFASELAMASRFAGIIIDLAIRLYWEDLLNKIILECCSSKP